MSFHISLPLLFKSLLCLLSLVLVNIQPSLANPGFSCDIPFLCGKIAAGYPFWGGGRLKFCGYPSLHLTCEEDDTPTMMISNVKYRVLDVNPEEQLLKIASQEYFQGLCPQKNITIDPPLLDIANGSEMLKLIYGCPKIPGKLTTCNMNTDVINYMDGFMQFTRDISLVPNCNTSVLVPVSKSWILAAKRKKEDLEEALKSGFEMKWKVLGCDESCSSCGFDVVSKKEICYCQDGQRSNSKGCSDSPKGATDEQQYQNCNAPFRCANIDNIGYPFWGGNRSESCGYPGFELNCEGDVPEITILNRTYKVLKIDNKSGAVTVAREDYWDDTCPSNLVNTTQNFNVFNYAPGTQTLTLYYSCPVNFMNDILGKQISPFQFHCNSYDETNTNYFYSWDVKIFNTSFTDAVKAYFRSCANSVMIPLPQATLESMVKNPGSVNLTRALQEGFGLQWIANNSLCDECERSKGQCGYSARTGLFNCYCPDKTYPDSCRSESGKKLSTGAGIGIAFGSAGALILGLGFFCCIRRRRKTAAYIKSKVLKTPPSSTSGTTTASTSTTTTTTNSSQSNPSHPYSRTDLEKGSSYFGAQVFSCSELEEATDNFDPSKQLGDGGFGAVYLGVLRDGRIVAIKRLYQNNFKRAEQFMNEIEILTKLQHKNLVKLYGCTSRQSRELLLVYEYIPNGTVADHLHNRQPNSCLLPWPVRLSIAIETADALAYLHASDVIHRDVKTNNILLDNNFRVRVADFGLSRLFPTDVTHVSTAPQGTPGYVDPEYFQCYKLTDKSDVYSFGVVLIELISGLQAVDTNRHRYDINLSNMAVKKIQNRALHELVDQSLGFEKDYAVRYMVTSVAELAFRCLQQDREMRPTMKQVLEILRETKDSHLGTQKAEVVEIRMADDAVLLNKDSPTLLPDGYGTATGTGTDKWVSSSNPSSSF